MDSKPDMARGQKESARRKPSPDCSVVLFLEVSVGPECPIRRRSDPPSWFQFSEACWWGQRLQRTVVCVSAAGRLFFTFRNFQVGRRRALASPDWLGQGRVGLGGWLDGATGSSVAVDWTSVCEGRRYQRCCSSSVQMGTSRASLMLQIQKYTFAH